MNMKNYRKRNFRRNSAGMNHTFAVLAVIFLSVFIVCGSVYLIFDFYSYYIAPALSGREVLTSADGSGGTASEILTGADALIWEAEFRRPSPATKPRNPLWYGRMCRKSPTYFSTP